jgi:hypothetical protein
VFVQHKHGCVVQGHADVLGVSSNGEQRGMNFVDCHYDVLRLYSSLCCLGCSGGSRARRLSRRREKRETRKWNRSTLLYLS